MPLGTSFRRSVPYLYLKAYALSTLVSIFASTPVSRRIPIERLRRWEQLRRRGEERIRLARIGLEESDIGRKFNEMRKEGEMKFEMATTRKRQVESRPSGSSNEQASKPIDRNGNNTRLLNAAERINREKEASLPLPFSALSNQSSLALQTSNTSSRLSKDITTPLPETVPRSSTADILRRWYRRAKELSEIRKLMKRDDEDEKTFPEIRWDAAVRRSREAHPAEVSFLAARKSRILNSGSFASFLQLSPSEAQELDPRDIPTVAIGGSGGGYRAMIGFAAFIETLQKRGAFDVVSFIAGVSGSCWTISSLYTIASLSSTNLLSHYRMMASENLHPMSRSALDVVARTKKGSFFLLAPLLRKAGSGIVGLGIMDLYATILNSYQLLSRDPHPPARLSRATFQWSKIWKRNGLEDGKAPLPVLTAVRLVHPEKIKKPKKKSKKEDVRSSDSGPGSNERTSTTLQKPLERASKFHWYEISPLEFGSADVSAWIPSWALGRSFRSGKSLSRSPEISLALILGMVTSAPAGPLTGYVSALLATLPTNTIMSNLLNKLNEFVKMSRWERRWGNPIRAADEPNPFYGLKDSSSGSETDTAQPKSVDPESLPLVERTLEWEASGRIKLMDAGLSNNSPSHVFYTSVREADVIVNFDASSDVQSGSGLERMFDFGKERGLELALASETSQSKSLSNLESPDLKDSPRRYAVQLNGWKENADGESRERSPDLRMLYCPLLPNEVQPDFNPATAPWCTSYNLIWKPEQVDILVKTASSNAEIVVKELRGVVREAWKAKRRKRMSEENREKEVKERNSQRFVEANVISTTDTSISK